MSAKERAGQGAGRDQQQLVAQLSTVGGPGAAAAAAGGGVDIGQQALEAKEAGIADVSRLLAAPEDLARLEQLRAEVASKLSSARSTLSAGVTAQVEAARYGMQLLDKSHRHIAKLRLCIDRIDDLCGECTTLVEHHDKIRALSYAHRNVSQVLEELGDIIDLPLRAAAVEQLLAGGDAGLVAAFEGLTVLEGTANNIKEAWRRNAKQSSDLGELSSYLTQVGDAVVAFERRLWCLARAYHALAQSAPRTLVDVGRIVEMQEQMDHHYAATKATYVRPRHYKERLLLEMEAGVAGRFAPLLSLCSRHGQPNTTLKFDAAGNRVVAEQRDYLGALTHVERLDRQGRHLPPPSEAELAGMQIREEASFDEERWLETLLGGLGQLEVELGEAYDYVSPCFPPHFNVFDTIFQMYHVQFAQAMDTVGGVAPKLSTAGQLRLMQWVCSYQQTLRGLGVQEELVRLPVAPLSDDPEGQPGFAQLLAVYMGRMEATMTAWFNAILTQDLAGQPQQLSDGTLRTPGVIDFFRMLNEQVSVLEEVSRGEVLLAAARRCLKLMTDFVAAQRRLTDPAAAAAVLQQAAAAAAAQPAQEAAGQALQGQAAQQGQGQGQAGGELGFEMVCALLNNSVDCYNQAVEFCQHVQSLLDEGVRQQLDVAGVCRAFLDLAQLWAARLVALIYADPGLRDQLAGLYTSKDWLDGTTTGTLLATIGDYFADVTTFVEPGFARRVAEGVLEELVRRACAGALAALERGLPAAAAALGPAGLAAASARAGGADIAGDAVLMRLAQDERDVQVFFEAFVPLDRLVKRVGQLSGLRELLDSRDPDAIAAGYAAVVEVNSAVTPAMVDRLLSHRPGLTKLQMAEVGVQVRELYSKALRQAAASGAPASGLPPLAPGGPGAGGAGGAGAAGAAETSGSRGWKFWSRGS